MASPKVGNRGSFGSKRSRNDDSKKEGDWTCSQCGNVNFGFRAVCNRSKCGSPRPPVSMSPARNSPYTYPPPDFFGGMGAPFPMHYGIPGRYGSQVPFPGTGYDYGLHVTPHGPYGYLPPFPPATIGGLPYGSGPPVNGYGYAYGFQGPPLPVLVIPDNTPSRKRRGGPDGVSGDDWICPECENVNFAFRTTCNIKKCGATKPSGPNGEVSGAPEGSWNCSCGNLNYPFRTACNRCGLEKIASS